MTENKRKNKRVSKRLPGIAEIDNKSHSVMITDFSKDGIQITTLAGAKPKKVKVELTIHLNDKLLKVGGNIKWLKRDMGKKTNQLGINLKNVPKEYEKELFNVFPGIEIN